jgi:cytochrome P450
LSHYYSHRLSNQKDFSLFGLSQWNGKYLKAFRQIHPAGETRNQLLDTLKTGAELDPATIARLPYLSAVCQETLRLYPIAINAFPRVVKQSMAVAGYALEPGTVIMPSIYLAHHREEIYPEPKQFRPERFLERQFSPYEYLPFGGGDRRCIGSAFALFEMKLVLFQLLSNRDLALVKTKPIRPIRRGLTMAPSNQLRMQVTGIH